jgi:outer membrane protein OmpA-like peptidoglycan-associated protein
MLIVLLGFSQEKTDKCFNQIDGQVFDTKNNHPLPNAAILVSNSNENIKTLTADSEGKFSIKLPCDNGRYVFTTTVENFTKSTKLIFTTRDTYKENNIVLDVFPISEFATVNNEKRIILNQIDFIPDDYDITPEAAIELRKVYDILNKYPDISLEIGFHSDSRGEV